MNDQLGFVLLSFNDFNIVYSFLRRLVDDIGDKFPVVVVDNCSEVAAFESFCERVSLTLDAASITIVRNDYNVGFGCGVNCGINVLRGLGCANVCVVNTDLEWGGKIDFDRICRDLSDESLIGIWSPQILDRQGRKKNPLVAVRFSFRQVLFLKLFFMAQLDRVYLVVRLLFLSAGNWDSPKKLVFKLFGRLSPVNDCDHNSSINDSDHKRYREVYCAHGAFIILSRSYLCRFQGYPLNVFMYCEEFFLGENCYKSGLKVVVDGSVTVVHAGSGAVSEAIPMRSARMRFVLRNTFISFRKFLISLSIRDF